MTDHVDTIVVGAGVVGLAVARELARRGQEVLILEAANAIGTGTSSRNSEVIHAGLYYPTGGLKAKLCRVGRDQLYAYCATHGVETKRIGKLVVATGAHQIAALEALHRQALANGVDDVRRIDAAEAAKLEPNVICHTGLLSPSTGIIDSHALMLSLLGEAENHGATLALNSAVTGGRIDAAGFALRVGDDFTIACSRLINAAGLHGPALARRLAGLPAEMIPPAYFAKGNYFALTGPSPFNRLVYPLPEPGGLGVHATLDLGGRVKFGPDVEWIADETYGVDPARVDRFQAAVRQYWPDLPDGALVPDYAGIRPKIVPAADFRIDGPADHGIAGLVNLFGIESPGLTASLAIAGLVGAKLTD